MNKLTEYQNTLLAACATVARVNRLEYAYILDDNDHVIYEKSGDDRSVNFTFEEMRFMKQNNAKILLHGHPMECSLSGADIRFALQLGVTIVAVTPCGNKYWATPQLSIPYQEHFSKNFPDVPQLVEQIPDREHGLIRHHYAHVFWSYLNKNIQFDYHYEINEETMAEIRCLENTCNRLTDLNQLLGEDRANNLY